MKNIFLPTMQGPDMKNIFLPTTQGPGMKNIFCKSEGLQAIYIYNINIHHNYQSCNIPGVYMTNSLLPNGGLLAYQHYLQQQLNVGRPL